MSLNRINTKPKAISLAIPNEPSSGLSKWIDLFSDHSGNDGHNDHSSSGGANSFMRPLITALIILILGYLGYQMFSGDHEGDDHHGADTEQMKHDEAKQDASMNALEDGNSADHKPKENMHDNASTDKGEGHGDDGLATMDQKGLDFEIGSWAYTLSDWLANGTGSKTFALDKIPFEGGLLKETNNCKILLKS